MARRRKRNPTRLVAGSEWMLAFYERSGWYIVPRNGLEPYALLEQYMTTPRAGRATGPHTEFVSIRVGEDDFVSLGANDYVSDELFDQVLAFVNRWGLLGLLWSGLVHCEFATDEQGWMLLEMDPPEDATWVASRGNAGRAPHASRPQRGALRYAPDARYGAPLARATVVRDPWTLPDVYFPDLARANARAVPAPDSADVFEHYSEYVGDIVLELVAFQRIYEALSSSKDHEAGRDWVNAQLSHISATLIGDRVGWAVDSLLDAMYLMLALDMTAARLPRTCARPSCGAAFMATRSNTRYCDDPCRYAENQRKYREKLRERK